VNRKLSLVPDPCSQGDGVPEAQPIAKKMTPRKKKVMASKQKKK